MRCKGLCTAQSRGFGWRIHCGVEVTESSTNIQHSLSLSHTHTHSLSLGGHADSLQKRCPAPPGVSFWNAASGVNFWSAELRSSAPKAYTLMDTPLGGPARLPDCPTLMAQRPAKATGRTVDIPPSGCPSSFPITFLDWSFLE